MVMTKRTPKSTVVAFKVEEELASFLNNLPNKSDFIRRAIYSQLGVACPVCEGTGRVGKEMHDNLVSFLEKWKLHHCSSCGDEFPVPKEPELAASLSEHWESLVQSGAEVCYTCCAKLDHTS